MTPRSRLALACVAAVLGGAASVAATPAWCLGFGSLGPVRTGMTVEQVLRLADWPGLERRKPAGDCWYMKYRAAGADFDLMILGGRVARIELTGESRLRTFSGARLGSAESDLRTLYGRGLESQPHKYDPDGRTLTFKSPDGTLGLRFETSHGKVTAIQSGPWEHLNLVEGCG
ncbi:MAG TPA: hypothetical protein VFL16_17125 [Steroidobacteraceae bacterium]|nr:hypothetical protein [Steroidobacteraceae bacterium]